MSLTVTFLFAVTMGFFDDILIPPESLQQPAKLYPDLECIAYYFNCTELELIVTVVQVAVEPSLATASAMKQSKFGFGNMRRTRGPMTSTWTKERRSVFGWQMKSSWIRRQRARPRQQQTRRLNRDSRRRHQQRTAGRRKRHRTHWL